MPSQLLALTAMKFKKDKKISIPERATISLAVKPLLEKAEMRPLTLKAGEGTLLLTSLTLPAVAESLLPN
jgi:hypothetical protein